VLNYNGRAVLEDCLRSVEGLRRPPGAVLMVDDGSDDGSPLAVASRFPSVRIVPMERHTGLLNRVRNRALDEARTPLVLLVDNDVTLAPDCLDELLVSLARQPRAVACMPRALHANDPSTIYQDGQTLHYAGATHAPARNLPVEDAPGTPRRSIGWGVQLLDRAVVADHGGFNEAYAMGWGDDGELHHRLNLSGHGCWTVPRAVCFHKRTFGARRYRGTVHNRLRFLLECYELRTLVLCAPALLVYELALIAFLAGQGALGDYLSGCWGALAELPSILTTRHRVQARRLVGDGALMTGGRIFVAPDYLGTPGQRRALEALESILDRYWRWVRPLLSHRAPAELADVEPA
jgi:hypothetical protein